MDLHTTTLVLTNDLRVIIKNIQLDTRIEISDINRSESVTLDLDRWNAIKQSIETIDKQFYKRFHYQHSSL